MLFIMHKPTINKICICIGIIVCINIYKSYEIACLLPVL